MLVTKWLMPLQGVPWTNYLSSGGPLTHPAPPSRAAHSGNTTSAKAQDDARPYLIASSLRACRITATPSTRPDLDRAANGAMPADRLLNNVLQYYQDVHDEPTTDQIIGSTVHLLSQLSNPLNLGVLTSQLLTAPAIWEQQQASPHGLSTSLRVLSIYNTAASRVRTRGDGGKAVTRGVLGPDAWARAVVRGADDRSSRWRHLLVLTGVLRGLNDATSSSLRSTLEEAVVTAANLALATRLQDGTVAAASTVLALNFAFPMLSHCHRLQINCSELLPTAMWCFTGMYGFQDGQFLDAISRDVVEAPQGLVAWHANTASFQQLAELASGPLMGGVGPLSKLIAFAAQHAVDAGAVIRAQDSLLAFTTNVLARWRANRFSNVDAALEGSLLSADTLQTTYPALWDLLKKLLFGGVAIQQGLISRSLLDWSMMSDAAATSSASKSLHVLRNLSFVSSREGNGLFQAYTFTYLASIDMLSRYPAAASSFLQSAVPADVAAMPKTHLQLVLDIFYLNTAEHFPLSLATDTCEALIVRPATAHLGHAAAMSPSIIELFESAHSAILATLACPQHSALTIEVAPFYIVKLFESFPDRISPRQFRLAFKAVMQVVSPPSPISALEPQLSEVLLEMLRASAVQASTEALPASKANVTGSPTATDSATSDELLSPQSSLILALIDSLPLLPLPLMEEWLTIAAREVSRIASPALRQPVKKRFCDVLVSGEMDVERAALCLAWWGTGGGKELVLLGGANAPPMMSGGLIPVAQESRL